MKNNIEAFRAIANRLGYSVERNVYSDNLINGIEQAIETRDGVKLYYYNENKKSYNDKSTYSKMIVCETTTELANALKAFKNEDDEKLNNIDNILGV